MRTGEHVDITLPGDKEKIAKTGTKRTKARHNIKIHIINLKSERNRYVTDSVIRFVVGGNWQYLTTDCEGKGFL